MNNPNPSFNLTDLEPYRKLFVLDNEPWTFRFELEGESRVRTVRFTDLPPLVAKGATIHTVLNATNGQGAKASDILGVRVLACDIDTPTSIGAILAYRFAPHLVIESSPTALLPYLLEDPPSGAILVRLR